VKLNSGYFITRPVFAPPNPIEAQKRPSTTFPLKARVPVHKTAGKRTWTRTKHGKPPSARKNVRTYVRAREPDYIHTYCHASNSLGKLLFSLDYKQNVLLQILVDGVPHKDLDVMWWRERIGYVGQVLQKLTGSKFI
jgi:hypothetical protein